MKIKKTDILLFLFLFASFPPNALIVYPVVKLMCNVVQVLGFVYLLATLVRKHVSVPLLFIMALFDTSLLLSTFLGNGQIYRCFVEVFNNMGIPILLASRIANVKSVIKISYRYFCFLCYLNFFSLIIGMFVLGLEADDSLFIVDANGITIYYIITVVLAVLYCELYQLRSHGSIIFLVVLCSVSELLVWSVTGMIAWFIFLMIYFWSQMGEKKRIPYFGTIIGSNIASVVLISSGVFPVFKELLEFFGREVTLTGRTAIWASAIEKIRYSPVIGYGYGEPASLQYNAHNQILEMLTNGGVILLFLFYSMYVYMGIKERGLTSEFVRSRGASVIKAALVGISIHMMTEVEPIAVLFLLFCVFESYISMVDRRKRK